MDFENVVDARRSVHEYSDEPIDQSTLREVFETATLSPSGYNLQPWEFLALREEETKTALMEAANGQEHVLEADTAVVVLGNTDPMAHAEPVFDDWLAKGYIPNEEVRSALLGNVEAMADVPEAERRVWTTRSTALAAMTLMYAARDHGVASCPMEGFDADAIVDAFDVPEGYEPVMIVTLGYPADGAADVENERKGRRPVDEVVHYESFDPSEDTRLETPDFGE
ncbi:nitroreductase family protein [Halorubrum sp. BOL3-1]|uniref:nitroreductase family protein n=1 Tax=Halorubrum sp. BOL3-1 TaxID=2497325 RepID=UPI001004DBB0|nr:nitroreductase family protein [Halorubrum sp. BOL3-1]QAU11946.1 nitroreductase family protein [Halorubrum sp. BOL3-1]